MQVLAPLSINALRAMSRAEAEMEIRARVQTVYMGQQTVLSRVLGFPKMFLSTTDLGFSSHVMLDGFWEIWLTLFLARTVKPGMVALDIGANYGYYTVLLGAAVGPTGRLISVEPIPATMALLTRTVALNGFSGWTTLVPAALAAPGVETVEMYLPPNEPKNATIVEQPREGSSTVPATCIDALTHKLDDLHIIKLDAEGAEADIFDGMKDTLRRMDPDLVVEFNGGRYHDAAGFLSRLRSSFRTMSALDFAGEMHPVTEDEVLARDTGEDWLLYLSRR